MVPTTLVAALVADPVARPLAAAGEPGGVGWQGVFLVLLFVALAFPVVKRFREQQEMLDQQRAERVIRQRRLDEQQRQREEGD